MSSEISNLINSLSENNFKSFVKEFLKVKYKTADIQIIDGPYDGGNDLEIIKDGIDIKRNIQITVQKANYENKLEKDLIKAKANSTKYNYLANLDFYISQNVSKESRNFLEDNAEVNHQITLKIFDGNYLAQQSENQTKLKELLYSFHGITVPQKPVFDKNTKIVFDVLTHNSDTIEIKKNFISSFIYSFLYTNPNSTADEIFENINPLLNHSLDRQFFDSELNYLRLKQFVISDKTTKRHVLSTAKNSEIKTLYNHVETEETLLFSRLGDILSSYSVTIEIENLLKILYKIYEENYEIDVEEVKETNNSFTNSVKKSFEDLKSFLAGEKVDDLIIDSLAHELIAVCAENEFLNKLSAVHLFTNLFNSDKLEKYLNSKHQEIFVDTQILIRLICVLYPTDFSFKDIALNSVKIFFDTYEKYQGKLKLVTSHDYIEEVTNHLIEALKLKRFLELPYISQLGTSKNVFYNTYLELSKNKYFEKEFSFVEFVAEIVGLEIAELDSENYHSLTNKIKRGFTETFDLMGFNIIYHEQYPNYSKFKKDYEMDLAHSSKFRSASAINNDLRTILYLSKKELHINTYGQIEEPYLVTWDLSFYSIRKKVMDYSDVDANFWYIYTPLKLVDRLSVMNLNLNPQSINLNIIALTENNFNYSSKNSSFLDVISSFFNKTDLSKFGIIRKLATLNAQAKEINSVHELKDFTEEEESPILKVLSEIRNHYTTPNSEFDFKDVITIFESESLESEIFNILSEALSGKKDNMYTALDKLMEDKLME